MADDWWSRNLGGAPPPKPVPPAYTGVPPAIPHGYQPQVPVQQQQQHLRAPTQPQRVDPENLFEQAMTWEGGEGVRKERTPCPQCGSMHFFSRSSKVSRGPAPAPVCYDCGYNGLFEQGDPATWGATG